MSKKKHNNLVVNALLKKLQPNKKNPVHVSIMGSCVSRDPFEFINTFDSYQGESETNYCIDKYIQSVSVFSAMSKPLPKEISDKIIIESQSSECANFFKKMLKLDITKSWYSYLCEAKSEWLILDFGNNRFPLLSYLNTILTCDLAKAVQTKRPDKDDSDELLKLCKGERIEPFDIDESLRKQMVSDFVSLLLKRFPQNRIIILNAHCVFSYIDPIVGDVSSPNFLVDKSSQQANSYMNFCYDCVSQLLPYAHYIDLPATTIGNTRHKWGKYSLHYVDEVSEYIYRAFDLIMTSGLSRKKEKAALAELKEHYTKVIFDKYTPLALSAIQKNRNLISLDEFAESGTYTKNGLTLIVQKEGKFSLIGTATENTIFFLLSHSKNPLGGWKSVEKTTKAGSYCFSTKVSSNDMQCYVQLVLANDESDKKWVLGDHTNSFTIDRDYKYRLIRVVTTKGTTANLSGELILEKMLFSETDRNV